MKVAFVINTSWNVYNFRKGLVQYFLSRGDKVLVLTPRDEYSPLIESWGVKWIDTPMDGTGVNPLKDLIYLKKIMAVFRKEHPDIVLSYTIKSNIYSCLAGKMTKVPVICNVSGLGTVFLVHGMTGKIAMLLYRMSFRYASHIFFQNEDDRELFTSRIFVSEKKTGILPGSGINLDEFKNHPLNPSIPVKVLMISRLIVEKGVREYAEAAAHFEGDEGVSFTLVGRLDEEHARSIEKEELERWIQKGWLHYLPHSDQIKELIKEHELIVLPSYREGTPRTLLEGAAMGRALLASDVPGCKEVVLDGYNGFLFEVRNFKSMVDKLKLYLSLSQSEKKELAANSRKLVEEKFDEALVIDKYKAVIDRIRAGS